ncbi:MAG: hypothetical protein M1837_004831 [Sclerophora amabilis]|nr:MAG: hypothetical protein M1837_004831 [Sclerophora amabilis]
MAPSYSESLDAITVSRPPATDNLTYCTILEYHLSRELLPALHEILQEGELTSDIGWDLVNLLTPLLPSSKQCLEDVARLGNPRECVIKALEALRQIKFDVKPDTSDSDYSEDNDISGPGPEPDGSETKQVDTISQPLSGSSDPKSGGDGAGTGTATPLIVFTSLIEALSTLHPRIKTAHPSRFLSTSLQAILATYAEATRALPTNEITEITSEIVAFVKALSGKKRPRLPPRKSTQDAFSKLQASAPDPEATDETPSSTENALQTRLLQAFTTHILEDYVLSISAGSTPALAWSSRLEEKTHPEKIVPGKVTLGQRFTDEPSLHTRETVVGQLAAIAKDLDLSSEDLLKTLIEVETPPEEWSEHDELPSSPSDVPLSKSGSLFLLSSRISSSVLFGSSLPAPSIPIFPTHALIVSSLIGTDEVGGLSGAGNEVQGLIDSVLALGLWSLNNGHIGELEEDEDRFHQYIQTLSLLSANTPSPMLRYNAHILCSSVLHRHPSDMTRLSIIRDTLEHCPYANLKGSAVAWLKDEMITAKQNEESRDETSIFSTPVAVGTLAPYLFPDLKDTLTNPPTLDAWVTFKTNFTFYLTALNFYFLLCTAPNLGERLDISNLEKDHDIQESFLDPLRSASKDFASSLRDGELLRHEGSSAASSAQMDLSLLDNVLERLTETGVNRG